MQFRTELTIPPAEAAITHQSRLLLVGSCFADEIGQRLAAYKFQTLINPFGTIFNPLSLFELLEKSHTGKPLATTLVERDGLFFHYGLHSRFFASTADDMQHLVQKQLQQVAEFWQVAPQADKWLLITLGTAWIYEHIATGVPVANCHKMPAHYFHKRLLQTEEIMAAFQKMYNVLPVGCRIVLTVSPVRHIKDTLPLNAVSKAVLRLAVHHICQQYEQVSYFPAYELLIDDLRDYRFYADDLLHPSQQAVEYIFEKFATAYFRQPTLELMHQWQKIRQGLLHKPLHPDSKAHRQFLLQLWHQLQQLAPYLDVQEEIDHLRTQLAL
ncbi:MAG: GSCFA domain-containing protein [Cytophagales bacterium]|nr:GSCFA domain-containing protein [Bernardetiaceae bacterium]MDW8204672.1 GSCFA domain-containing protein [Cytophagales bacterium]